MFQTHFMYLLIAKILNETIVTSGGGILFLFKKQVIHLTIFLVESKALTLIVGNYHLVTYFFSAF